jgi:D-lactate dehydrogenase
MSGGAAVAEGALRAFRSVVSPELIPCWLPNIPSPAAGTLPATTRAGAAAVYFHACVNRVFGEAANTEAQPSLAEAMVAVSARAGLPLWIPDDLAGTCCATVWHSKGYSDGNRLAANGIVEKMWEWTAGGQIPVVCDASSCTLGISSEILPSLSPENAKRHGQLKLLDSVAWARDELLPRLTVSRRVASAAIHPVCSIHHLGLVDKLQSLVAALADKSVTPIHATCCGFAGDRGFLHPELTKSATAEEAAEINQASFDAHVCSNRTCEIGLNLATGRSYRSIILLLEQLTRI